MKEQQSPNQNGFNLRAKKQDLQNQTAQNQAEQNQNLQGQNLRQGFAAPATGGASAVGLPKNAAPAVSVPQNGAPTAGVPQNIAPQNAASAAGFLKNGAMPGSGKTFAVAVKPPFAVTGKDVAFALLLLVVNIMGVSLSIWGGFHAGVTLFYGLTFLLLTVYFWQRGQRPGLFALFCGASSLAVSLNFVVSANPAVNFFSLLAIFVLAAVWFAALTNKEHKIGDLAVLRTVFGTVFGNAFGSGGRAVQSICKAGRGKGVLKALVGIACALPFLCVVLPLLVRSDPAFEGMVTALLGDPAALLLKLLLGFGLTVLMLGYAFGLKKEAAPDLSQSTFKGVEGTYFVAFLSVLGLCYLFYLFSQLSYFFKAFGGFLPQGFTAAAYARRGFFEMCFIALLNNLVLFLFVLLVQKKNGRPPVAMRLLSYFIGLFSLFMIAAALAKMALYISRFGTTVLRIGTSAFAVLLAVVTVAVLLRCRLPRVQVLKVFLSTAAVLLCVLGLGNLNGFVAQYNFNAYQTGALKTVDVAALAELGDAGVPYLIALTSDSNEETALLAHNFLADYLAENFKTAKSGLSPKRRPAGSFSLVRGKAEKQAKEYIAKTKNAAEHLTTNKAALEKYGWPDDDPEELNNTAYGLEP